MNKFFSRGQLDWLGGATMSKILSPEQLARILESLGYTQRTVDAADAIEASHESLRQAERRGWSAAERHSLMWQTAVRQGEMLTTENRCLRERVEELEAQLRLWRSQTITFGGMPTDGEARAALEADDE